MGTRSLGPRRISSLAGRPNLMAPTKTGDGALMGTAGGAPRPHIHAHDIFRVTSRADRRSHQRAHPHRRHLAIYLPRRHFCSSGEILGMSSERYHQNEIIRFDTGRDVIVSLCVGGTHEKPDGRVRARARSLQTMFTAYKLWFIFIDLRHWVTSCCPRKFMIRPDNVSALVNQSYRLGRPVPERLNLHHL